MQYRTIGSTGIKTSALGIGAMRLPALDDVTSSANIDETAAIELIRHSIDGGVNYLDTAYNYHQGRSEVVVGKALQDGYRDKVLLATKLPMPKVNERADFDRLLNESLSRLNTDHLDFYLYHGIGARDWEKIQRLDLLSCAEAAKADGRIGQICFSFHDGYDAFEQIINGYDDWGFAQILYNYMDVDKQAGAAGVELAAARGVGIVVMEPLRGGKLARPIPAVQELLSAEGYAGNFVDLALRFVWDNPHVSVVLSGMTTLEQLDENLEFADRALPDNLTSIERELVVKIREVYDAQDGIPCTSCGYCMPCPQDLKIPMAINLYNEKLTYGYGEESRRVYNLWGKGPAEGCIQCLECEEKCPQEIAISQWMPKIDAEFAETR
jgi:predicted aldo/keto reductase-like oxidoreductase